MDEILNLIMDLEFIGIIIMCIIIIEFKRDNFFEKFIQVLLIICLFAVTGLTIYF
ncbi:hypothetical protein LIIV107777_12470 [Listeria ivanovii subsp. ivanovii]|nr:hypothetical protein AX25_01780 [Listeria ivanovii WSLC3009]SNV35656.1 Uncharacterised protein [Listeria ivanovii subsp. ivanovii]SNV81129.1 Uncharacterised protein [Listeria ivanovii subsp. ivanovii]